MPGSGYTSSSPDDGYTGSPSTRGDSDIDKKPRRRNGASWQNITWTILFFYGAFMVFLNVEITSKAQINTNTKSVKDMLYRSLQDFVQPATENPSKALRNNQKNQNSKGERRILTAYLEAPWTPQEWAATPLVERNGKKNELYVETYPQVTSCRNLPSQFPIDASPCEKDPFLPWIHDVFPSPDGTKIQFVAQNKRRCNTGAAFSAQKAFYKPQVALFQSVPIKRITDANNSTRYKLVTSYDQADEDGSETRFICKFQPSGLETLSKHNINYDWHTIRKGYASTFTEEGFDVHMIWSSQLIFYCPVPKQLQSKVASGETVLDDYATLYVDLIPIRTKPRFGHPTEFLPPRFFGIVPVSYNTTKEWGINGYVLPPIEASGRWANIPICRPPLVEKQIEISEWQDQSAVGAEVTPTKEGVKPHRLVACTWTSVGFKTRGDASTITDGPERLKQWIEFNLMAGFDHVYVYDNSGHFQAGDTPHPSLEHITNLFPPTKVTRIDWPAKICNNNKANSANKGERSSQYAAEASCMLRYGPHTDWFGSMDTDEYFVPYEGDLKTILSTMDEKGHKILTFRSQRAIPRLDMIE